LNNIGKGSANLKRKKSAVSPRHREENKMASVKANQALKTKKAIHCCGNEFFFKLDDVCQAHKPDSFFVRCPKCKEPVEINKIQNLNFKEYEILCCRFGMTPFK
jgi:hypothetical protein